MSILFEPGTENLSCDSCKLSPREDVTKRRLRRSLPCLCTIIRPRNGVYSLGCELLHVPYHHTV